MYVAIGDQLQATILLTDTALGWIIFFFGLVTYYTTQKVGSMGGGGEHFILDKNFNLFDVLFDGNK